MLPSLLAFSCWLCYTFANPSQAESTCSLSTSKPRGYVMEFPSPILYCMCLRASMIGAALQWPYQWSENLPSPLSSSWKPSKHTRCVWVSKGVERRGQRKTEKQVVNGGQFATDKRKKQWQYKGSRLRSRRERPETCTTKNFNFFFDPHCPNDRASYLSLSKS